MLLEESTKLWWFHNLGNFIFDMINTIPALTPAVAWKQTVPWLSAVLHQQKMFGFLFILWYYRWLPRPNVFSLCKGAAQIQQWMTRRKLIMRKQTELLCDFWEDLHRLKLPFPWSQLCMKFSQKSCLSRNMFEMKSYFHVVRNAHGLVGVGSVCSAWESIVKNLIFCPANFYFLSWISYLLILIFRKAVNCWLNNKGEFEY